VKIYDRWGSIIYESVDYKNDWDGTSSGKNLPEGAYFYFLRSLKKGNLSGSINLVR
jgi:gliding motility-associated-like protein